MGLDKNSATHDRDGVQPDLHRNTNKSGRGRWRSYLGKQCRMGT
jgi:hypothetical protein